MKKVFVIFSICVFCLAFTSISFADVKPYPLNVCIVSDQNLGSMGDAIEYEYKGQMIKFCCVGCVAMFKADPDKYLNKLQEKVAAMAEESAKSSSK